MAKRGRSGRNGSGRKRRSSPPPPPDFWAMNGKKVIGAVFAIVIVIVAAYVIVNYEGDAPPTDNHDPAPTFSINSIDGGPIELQAYQGKVVVLDLFATWCGPCEQQMEALNNLRSQYPRSRVEILSVDVDPEETLQEIRDFRDRFNADWTFASDTDDLSTKYDAGSIPTLAIIDREGNLVWRHVGVASIGTLKAQIDPLLTVSQ